MTKILCVSDPHYHNYKLNSTIENGANSRCRHVDDAMKAATEVGINNGADLMMITGDVFHERGRIRPSVFNMAYKRLQACAVEFPVIMTIGNHDMEDYKLGASSIDTFESITNCFVLGGGKGYAFLDLKGVKTLGIQYCHKTEDFKQVFENALDEHTNPDVVMIHQGIDDFKHTGIPETKITCEYLTSKTDAWVICGHYHSPRQKGKVINVGAPLQHTFGDEGIDRGCWIIDPREGNVEFHKLAATPEFITIKEKKEAKLAKGCFVRVHAKNQRTATTIKKAAEDAGALSVVTYVDKVHTTAHTKTVSISSDPKVMISDYCDLIPRYSTRKTSLVEMFEKVCL